MRFAPLLLACVLGCVRIAGLDDLEIQRDAAVANVAPETTGDSARCEAADLPVPKCPGTMIAIPGGCFVPRLGGKPSVTLAPFCVDVYEVTVAAYRACVEDGMCPAPETTVTREPEVSDALWNSYNRLCNVNIEGNDAHPLNCVSALSADAYCAARGARLPKDDEWEWLAHGGAADSIFPWGNESAVDQPCWKNTQTCEVGMSRDVNPMGVRDLAGNVGEWTSTSVGTLRRARGGAWMNTLASQLTQSGDLVPEMRMNALGFRCVK